MKGMQGFNRVAEWLTRLTVLNFIWIAFCLMGLGIAGFFPATAALFSVIRKYQVGQGQVRIYQDFKRAFKDNLIQANLLGYSYLILVALLWVDYRYLLSTGDYWLVTLSFVFLVAVLMVALAWALHYPIFVQYHLSYKDYILNPFRWMVLHLRRSLAIIALLLIWWRFVDYLPGVLLFLGTSLPAFIIQSQVMVTIKAESQKENGKTKDLLMSQEDVLYYL